MLLEERLKNEEPSSADSTSSDQSEVRGLYERAVEAAPSDALSRADLGRFLLVRAKDYTKAQVSSTLHSLSNLLIYKLIDLS